MPTDDALQQDELEDHELNADQPNLEVLLEGLESVFERRKKAQEFSEEREVYADLIPRLIEDLKPVYVLKKAHALGSTATLWVVVDHKLKQKRALKLPRPRQSKLKNIIRILRAERVRLAALNHQNIVKVYAPGEIELTIQGDEYSFPYFIMEFLRDVQDLDDYIISNQRSLVAGDVIAYFRDVMSGLSFLHQQSIVHCDIKPGNILIAPDRPALVADLGYAKHLLKLGQEERKLTHVTYTPRYAHPELRQQMIESSDSAANIAVIEKEKLRPAYDLFAFGRSMQEVLTRFRDAEKKNPEKGYGQQSIFSHYQWLYLGFIAKRLLDGVVEIHDDDDLASDVIPGLPDEVMREIRYLDADEALEDFEKLLHLYDLEGEIPELNPNLPTFIQIPHCQVPLTQRVKEVINHPTFMRLNQVTQLGFVSLVYPGATHTRFEHVLGTFTHCCDYMRALWYDQANCLFQSIMSKKDIELGLLAALLHDIGQYPMAHDLTEIATEFAHEKFTQQALERVGPEFEESLANVVRNEWDIEPDDILRVIHANKASTFRHRLLNSLIDGPLDCDKLDYLRRDSTHLGVTFGLSIDHERLLRNLTTVYESVDDTIVGFDGRESRVRRLEVAEIGVTEKALVVAQSLWKVRKDMFTQMYWQHTNRALKAMLGYVVRNILLRLSIEEERAGFWAAFHEFLFSPMAYTLLESSKRNVSEPSSLPASSDSIEPSEELGLEFEQPASEGEPLSVSQLSPSDDSLLRFLWGFALPEEKKILRAMQSRKVYRRLAVLSGVRGKNTYDSIYGRFRNYRLDNDIKRIEENRQTWESEIVSAVGTRLHEISALIPPDARKEDILNALRQIKPLILVDIPVKTISKTIDDEVLWYLPEDFSGVHSRHPSAFPRFSKSSLDIEQSGFDKDVGKIRVLAHPEYRDFLDRCLPEKVILDILSM